MYVNKININQSELTYDIVSDVYDVSTRNNGATFASLGALLSSENLSTFIPLAVRCGGMSIRFIQSSDNNYVQYFCNYQTFSTDVSYWEKINLEENVDEINTAVDGVIYPVFINRDKLIRKEGFWTSFSGYNAYVFDVRAVKGQTIIFNNIKRANSFIFTFVTDYKTIPSYEDTELWNSLFVEGTQAYESNDTFEYKCLVPTTANYLILSGTDTNPATLEQLSNINDRIDGLDKKYENINTTAFEISKLKGGNLLLESVNEIAEILNNGGVAGNNIGYFFNYGYGYKTTIFDVRYLNEITKINITSVVYGTGYVYAFCKDYKTLPIKKEFEADSSLWLNNVVSASSGRGIITGTVYSRIIRKPKDAKYLLLVSNSSTQATVNVVEEGILNIQDNEIPFISFSDTGHFINLNGSVGNSNNWEQSNIFQLRRGQKLTFSAKTTSNLGVLLALTDENGSYFEPIISGGSIIREYSYLAEEDCYVILQYYRIDGSPTVINDSIRLTSIEKEISNIKDVDNITPEYIAKETQRVYDELLSKLNKDTLIVAFNTDQHIEPNVIIDAEANPKYALHGIKSIANLSKKLPLDFVVLGGDVAGYDNVVSNTVEGILSEINMINEPFTEINTTVISLPGNHDAFQNNDNITSYGMYNVNFKRSKFIKELAHNGVDNCDSYWDDYDNKVRYIFLDTWSTNVRTESYSDFLSNALSTMEVDYKALIFSHNPLTNEFDGIIKKYRSPSDETGTDAFANPSDLHAILNQYANSIIACICGHSHADVYGVSSAGILYIETTSATHSRMIFRDNGLVVPYKGVLNTAKETSYDYFVVNLTEQTIEAIRFGQGSNRKWYYKGENIGLISYTNYVYGKTSIENVALTFTNNANSSDIVTVTSDSNGDYGIYLKLGATYTISSTSYTLDTTEITVNENTELNITVE